MDPATIALIGNIMSLFFQYGVPAVMNAVNALNKEEITAEDIEALKAILAPPESYT